VAVGSNNNALQQWNIVTSPDAINWTVSTNTSRVSFVMLRDVTYGGGSFIAVGQGEPNMLMSSNGDDWSAGNSGTGATLYGIIYNP